MALLPTGYRFCDCCADDAVDAFIKAAACVAEPIVVQDRAPHNKHDLNLAQKEDDTKVCSRLPSPNGSWMT